MWGEALSSGLGFGNLQGDEMVRSTLLRIGLSDFAWVGPKLAIPALKRRVQNSDFGTKFHWDQWTIFRKTKFADPHLYRSFDF